MGDQILLTHSLLSRDVKSGDLQDISGATIPELTSRSLVLLPKLHISVKQASGEPPGNKHAARQSPDQHILHIAS